LDSTLLLRRDEAEKDASVRLPVKTPTKSKSDRSIPTCLVARGADSTVPDVSRATYFVLATHAPGTCLRKLLVYGASCSRYMRTY